MESSKIVDKRADQSIREAHTDRIARLDRQQNGPNRVICPINPDHGGMGVHRDGEALLCTAVVQRQPTIKLCHGHQVLSASE